jgi:uncharacterized phage protein gp47/JayE
MAVFQLPTAASLERVMLARILSRGAGLTDVEPGSVLRQVVAAVARAVEIGGLTTAQLLQLFSIAAAQGADLDARALDYLPDGLLRRGASRAGGTLRWTRTIGTASAIIIPAGTRVGRPGSNPVVTFVTTAPGEIPAFGTQSVRTDGPGGDIPARAEAPGTSGNSAIGSVTLGLSTVAGTNAVSNPTPFTGGVNQETDDQFRARIVEYTASLAHATRPALEFRARQAEIDGQRVTLARAIQTPYDVAFSTMYVDDGTGAIETFATTAANEDFVTSATGGESRFYTQFYPLRGSAWNVVLDPAIGPTRTLVYDVDYRVTAPWGLLVLSPTAFPTGLAAGDRLYIEPYQYFTGLIAEAQRLIDGDPADLVNFPMWRAEGVVVRVLAPFPVTINVSCSIVVAQGFARSTVAVLVQQAIAAYIASLNIGEDVILAALIERAMSVEGMFDVVFSLPLGNIAIADNQVARANISNISVS